MVFFRSHVLFLLPFAVLHWFNGVPDSIVRVFVSLCSLLYLPERFVEGRRTDFEQDFWGRQVGTFGQVMMGDKTGGDIDVVNGLLW